MEEVHEATQVEMPYMKEGRERREEGRKVGRKEGRNDGWKESGAREREMQKEG